MSYQEQMRSLATAVADLVGDGGQVHGDDLRAAVAGHAALVSLLKTVHRDVSGIRRPLPRRDPGAEIERHPVAELGRLLEAQPWVTDQPLQDVLTSVPTDQVGQRWREVARTAVAARQAWEVDGPVPTGKAAWTQMADVAALAEAVAVLDGDIADSMAAVARTQDAARFRLAERSGLGLVARQVTGLAASGPLPDHAPAVQAAGVPAARDLAGFVRSLRAAVAQAPEFTPAQLAATAFAVADVAGVAARSVKAADPGSALGRELQSQARRLAGVGRNIAEVTSAMSGPPGAGPDIRQIRHLTGMLRTHGQRLTVASAHEVAAAVPELTRELLSSAERQVRSGAWLVQRGPGELGGWIRYREGLNEPRVIATLRRAAQQAPAITQTLNATAAVARPERAPRVVLARALARRPAAQRPATPGTARYQTPRPLPRGR